MNFQQYVKTHRGATDENRFHRRANVALIGAVLVLAILLFTRDHTIIVVPASLDGKAEISSKKASENLYSAWGVHIATLLGNVTPTSAGFLTDALSPVLAPSIYRTVLDAVDSQVKHIKDEQLTLSFAPSEARFDQQSQTVWVTGELITRGVRGTEQRELRTYEMKFAVSNHRVLLTDIRVNKGRPSEQQVQQQPTPPPVG